MKSLILALIVVANFYFIESVNATCFLGMGSCDRSSDQSYFPENNPNSAPARWEAEQEERARRNQEEQYRQQQYYRQQQQQQYYIQQQQRQEQMRQQQAEQQRQEQIRQQQADQQRYDQFGNPVGVSTYRFTIPANR
jgi:hypothetical protein